ncbi:hypothetical protein BC629DRAFT_342664 [Irpex lacteus]|nr:hypothetical protein BC629DRAFT_342664 [Irpex lacteus]
MYGWYSLHCMVVCKYLNFRNVKLDLGFPLSLKKPKPTRRNGSQALRDVPQASQNASRTYCTFEAGSPVGGRHRLIIALNTRLPRRLDCPSVVCCAPLCLELYTTTCQPVDELLFPWCSRTMLNIRLLIVLTNTWIHRIVFLARESRLYQVTCPVY